MKPSRRDFLRTAGLGAAALAGSDLLAAIRLQEVDSRPNLLIIHTDQQSCWTVGAYGGGPVDTPHIDSLARDGALFENFMTNSAVCSPSRACLLTGRYPNSHGVYKNNVPLPDDEITIAHVLGKAGYETGYAGKWHLNGTPKPGWAAKGEGHGFEDCRFLFNRGHWKIIDEQEDGEPRLSDKEIGDARTYTTDWLAQRTIDFLERPRKKPFCYMVSIPDPHTPYTVRSPYDTMFKPGEIELPATVNEREGAEVRSPEKYKKFAANLRQWKAQYCGEVKCIDDGVGRILACLDEHGSAENTIVAFTSDHGDYMGEHGLTGKNMLYETAFRVPAIVRWPKGIAGGRRIGEIVSTVDFAPTMLALMGVSAPRRMQGNDGSHLLLGKDGRWDDLSYSYHSSNDCAGLITPRYQLAVSRKGFSLKSAPGRMLYDRVEDPDQRRNLIDAPGHREMVARMTARILRHHSELKTPAAAWLKEL